MKTKYKKSKYRKMKAKLMVTIVLPLFTILLAVKVAQTFIRIKVRDLFAKPAASQEAASGPKPVPTPVPFQTVDKEFIRPAPADHQIKEQSPV